MLYLSAKSIAFSPFSISAIVFDLIPFVHDLLFSLPRLSSIFCFGVST